MAVDPRDPRFSAVPPARPKGRQVPASASLGPPVLGVIGKDGQAVMLEPSTTGAFHCECGSDVFVTEPLVRLAFDILDKKRHGVITAPELMRLRCASCRSPLPPIGSEDLVELLEAAMDEQKEIDRDGEIAGSAEDKRDGP